MATCHVAAGAHAGRVFWLSFLYLLGQLKVVFVLIPAEVRLREENKTPHEKQCYSISIHLFYCRIQKDRHSGSVRIVFPVLSAILWDMPHLVLYLCSIWTTDSGRYPRLFHIPGSHADSQAPCIVHFVLEHIPCRHLHVRYSIHDLPHWFRWWLFAKWMSDHPVIGIIVTIVSCILSSSSYNAFISEKNRSSRHWILRSNS